MEELVSQCPQLRVTVAGVNINTDVQGHGHTTVDAVKRDCLEVLSQHGVSVADLKKPVSEFRAEWLTFEKFEEGHMIYSLVRGRCPAALLAAG